MLWIDVLITLVNLIWLITIKKVFKTKTRIDVNFVLQILIPLSIIIAFAALEWYFELLDQSFILIFAGFNFLLLAFLFLLFNFTYFWFKQHYSQGPERLVIHNFKNCEADGAPTNTFKSKFEQNINFVQLVSTNLDTLIEISTNDFLREIIEDYEDKHGKTTLLITEGVSELPSNNLQPNPEPSKSKTKTKRKKEQESQNVETKEGQEIQENYVENEINIRKTKIQEAEIKKATFIEILKKEFSGWYFHILYYHWDFLVPFVDENLSSYVKAYIFSLRADLPIVLNLNCALLYPEFENGKRMTALFCLEGPRNEIALTKITNYAKELDSFVKPWPKIFEIERVKKERDWWQAFAIGLKDGDDKILKTAITLATRRKRLIPDEESEKTLKEIRKHRDEGLMIP